MSKTASRGGFKSLRGLTMRGPYKSTRTMIRAQSQPKVEFKLRAKDKLEFLMPS